MHVRRQQVMRGGDIGEEQIERRFAISIFNANRPMSRAVLRLVQQLLRYHDCMGVRSCQVSAFSPFPIAMKRAASSQVKMETGHVRRADLDQDYLTQIAEIVGPIPNF